MQAARLPIFLCIVAGCYPAFHLTTAPPVLEDPNIGESVRKLLAAYTEACTKNLDAARQDAYDSHKLQYQAGVFGSIATLSTGSVAGAFGVADQKALSGVSGGLSLASGIITLIAVNKPAIDSAEKRQETLFTAWNHMVTARRAYEAAVLTNDSAQKTAALKELVAGLAECGLPPPQPGLL